MGRPLFDARILVHADHSPSPKIGLDGACMDSSRAKRGVLNIALTSGSVSMRCFLENTPRQRNLAVRGATLDSRVTGKGGLVNS